MDEATLSIERLVAGGDGFAREESGRVVFVEAAAPGDRVRVRFVEQKRDFAKARIVELLDAGASRVEPPCAEVARGCGGCGWQHLDPDAARQHKAELVVEAARRIGHLDLDVECGADLGAKRTSVRMIADGDALGFRRRQSHDPIGVASCLIAHPLIDDVVGSASLAGADEVTIRCSPSTRTRHAVIHGPAGATLSPVPPDLTVVVDDELDGAGRAVLVHEVNGARFEVSARSFFQSSHEGAVALVSAVRSMTAAAPTGRFVDLYGGVGLFAATCAGDRQVVLVESNKSSSADAERNLAGRDATIVAGQVEQWAAVDAAVVVADPPRTGLRPKGIERVVATGATRVVLISCDAAAFARDVAGLTEAGYVVERCQSLDLFPFTHHVEVVTSLVRR